MTSPVITTRFPPANGLNSDPASNVTVNSDQTLNPATVTNSTLVVHGLHGQLLSSDGDSFSASGAQATVNPGADFHAGEVVQVTVTSGIQNGGAEGAVRQVWNFTTKPTAGTGQFTQGQDLGGGNSRGVAIGDLDGDGDLDVVFGNYSGGSKIWFNDGAANFTVSAQTLTSNSAQSIQLGDFDGDGDLDLVEGINNDPNQVWINDGAGAFTAGQGLTRSATSDGSTTEEGIADLDGDGDLDIYDVNNFGQEAVVWLNDGAANFTRTQEFGGTDGQAVALADIDGDGDLDALEAANDSTSPTWINDGAGNFSAGPNFRTGNLRAVDAADIDGDGDVDLIAGTNNGVTRLVINDGSGIFSNGATVLSGVGNSVYSARFADLNADGAPDLILGLQGGSNNQVRLNNGRGSFSLAASFGGGNTENVATGDLDGDGDIDIVFANDSGGTNQVWLNRGGVDLTVALAESADPVLAQAGNTVTYTATVTNHGPEDATGLVINQALTLPAGVSVSTAVPSTGSYTAPSWNIGGLASGNSATLTITLDVGASATAGTDVIVGTTSVGAITEPRSNTTDDSASVATTVIRQVDLAVAHVESIDPVIAGSGTGKLTHTVTLSNIGPSDASGITLQDVISMPAGVTVQSVTPSAGSFTAPDWMLPTLASGGNATLTVSFTASPSAAVGTDVIQSSASVTAANEPLLNTGDNSLSIATGIDRQVDIFVSKVESIDPVVAGTGTGNLTHTLSVVNNGPSDASGVVFSDVLSVPAGVSVDTVVTSVGSFAAPTWTVGNLSAGASASLTASMTASASAASGTDVITDAAMLTAINETLINTGDDVDAEATSVTRQVDLVVTKMESVDPVTAGSGAGNLLHTVTLTNNGPSDASGVVISDVLGVPSGVSVDSVVPSTGSFTAPNWSIATLPASGSATLTATITAGPAAAGGTDVITDTAQVVSANEPLISTGDDADSEATSLLADADLALTHTDAPDPVVAGETLTLSLGLTNQGPVDVSDAVVVDELPTGASYASDDCGAGPPAGTTLTWNVGALPVGNSVNCTVTLDVDPDTGGTLTSTATATSSRPDPTSPNEVVVTTVVDRHADLVLELATASPPPTAFGDLIVLDLTLTNNGSSSANDTSVDVVIPNAVSYVSDTCGGSGVPVFTWAPGYLAAGAIETCSLTTLVQRSGAIQFSGSATATEVDPSPANATASFSFGVLAVPIPAMDALGLGLLEAEIGILALRQLRG